MATAPTGIRLQKVIAAAGLASRRAAETLIQDGRVTVNGKVVSELGSRADPDVDDIRLDGRRVPQVGRRRYLLLNKPRAVMTTRHDPERRRTVMDLLKDVHESVYPVGRLDYDSEGLLLLTNDGELAAQLTHPRHGLERVYEARVRGVPDSGALKRLAQGVMLEGRRTSPAKASLVAAGRGRDGNQGVVRLTLTEGRNRQVRQMCEAVGHPVVRLRRVRIGPIQDDALRPGRYRDLAPGEVAALRRAVARAEGETEAAPNAPGRTRRSTTRTAARTVRRHDDSTRPGHRD